MADENSSIGLFHNPYYLGPRLAVVMTGGVHSIRERRSGRSEAYARMLLIGNYGDKAIIAWVEIAAQANGMTIAPGEVKKLFVDYYFERDAIGGFGAGESKLEETRGALKIYDALFAGEQEAPAQSTPPKWENIFGRLFGAPAPSPVQVKKKGS